MARKYPPIWILEATHPYDKITTMVYFYDGELPVTAGIVKVPKSKPYWAKQLLNDGYHFLDDEWPEDFHVETL